MMSYLAPIILLQTLHVTHLSYVDKERWELARCLVLSAAIESDGGHARRLRQELVPRCVGQDRRNVSSRHLTLRSGRRSPARAREHPSARFAKPINAASGFGEKRRLFVTRPGGCQTLESVPQHLVAEHPFINGKVAFEHATPRSKEFEAGIEIGTPRVSQFVRARRHSFVREAKAENGHTCAAELDIRVRQLGKTRHCLTPVPMHAKPASRIRTHTDRTAEMVDHDRDVRSGNRKVNEFIELRLGRRGFDPRQTRGSLPRRVRESL